MYAQSAQFFPPRPAAAGRPGVRMELAAPESVGLSAPRLAAAARVLEDAVGSKCVRTTDAKLAQKLGQLTHLEDGIFSQECVGLLASFGPT